MKQSSGSLFVSLTLFTFFEVRLIKLRLLGLSRWPSVMWLFVDSSALVFVLLLLLVLLRFRLLLLCWLSAFWCFGEYSPFRCFCIGLSSQLFGFVSASIINSGIMWGVRLFRRNFETDDACALLRLRSDEPSSVGRLIFARPRKVFISSLMFQLFLAEHSMTWFRAPKSDGLMGGMMKGWRKKET